MNRPTREKVIRPHSRYFWTLRKVLLHVQNWGQEALLNFRKMALSLSYRKVKYRLYLWKLRRVLNQRCDERSESPCLHRPEVCYWVYLKVDDEIHPALVNSIDGENILIQRSKAEGLSPGMRTFDGVDQERYPLAKALSRVFFFSDDPLIVRNGILSLIISDLLLLSYFSPKFLSFSNWIKTAFFNRRKVISNERVELLKDLLEMNRRENIVYVSSQIVDHKYGKDFYRHPASYEVFRSTDFMLTMLKKTEDVEETDSNPSHYIVTGKGILAITQFEEDERKHKESMAYQRWLLIVTTVLAVTGILQNSGQICSFFGKTINCLSLSSLF